MSCCISPPPDEDTPRTPKQQNRAIERALAVERRVAKRTVKVLLLGAGESGKSTVQRAMKAVHSPEGLTAEECERRMEAIFLHVCDSARTIATAMTAMRIPFTDPENCQPCVALLEAAAGQHPVEWDNSLLMACRTLWADQGFRLCFSRSREYQLNDNTDYFFNALDRLTSLNYVPTPLDVFRSRAKTVGIYETRINFPNNILCTVTDVGGQQSERRKWAQCFAGVTAIIFVVATSEYDQLLREDGRTNRLREAFRVFREVWEDRFLATTPIILFLNKTDLLAAKLPISDFRVHFPEYNQEVADYESVTQYLIRRFAQTGRQANVNLKRQLYPHLTCAVDPDLMRRIFLTVKDIIVGSMLDNQGLV